MCAILLILSACSRGSEEEERVQYEPPKPRRQTAVPKYRPPRVKDDYPTRPTPTAPPVRFLPPEEPDPDDSPEAAMLAGEVFIDALVAVAAFEMEKDAKKKAALRSQAIVLLQETLSVFDFAEVMQVPFEKADRQEARRLLKRLRDRIR